MTHLSDDPMDAVQHTEPPRPVWVVTLKHECEDEVTRVFVGLARTALEALGIVDTLAHDRWQAQIDKGANLVLDTAKSEVRVEEQYSKKRFVWETFWITEYGL